MKAIVYERYGRPEVLHLKEVKNPSPRSNEVLVKVYATAVSSADIMMRKGKPTIGRLYLGLKRPKKPILGFDFSGEIVAVGKDVTLFKIEDKVFGGTTALGCYAEYVCVNEEDVLITMPESITLEEAAPVSSNAITVMNFLIGLANIKENDSILIIGASGGLGTYAVQLARYFGAKVTGVCSTSNVELVKSLGAEIVIDYTKEDFTKSRVQYDIIFDAVAKSSFSQCKKSLSQNGVYLSTVISFPLLIQMMWTSFIGKRKAKSSATGMLSTSKRLSYLKEITAILDTGKIKSVIDRSYPLKEIADAHAYVEKGHKKGNVIITI